MCRACLERIVKADNDEFLDSLDLTESERATLEKLYVNGEGAIVDILGLQGKELDEAIQAISDDLIVEADELLKVMLEIQAGEFFQKKFEEVLENAFTPLFELAGKSVLLDINPEVKWNTANKGAAEFVENLRDLIPSMNETSTNHLLGAFKKAIEEGKTPQERAALVREVSKQAAEGEEGPFSTVRATRIARTMSTAAANGGRLEGWKQSGSVKKKKWRAANQKRTRKDHKDANGQVVEIDKPFEVGGEELMYPGDPSASAKQIANCRCTMQAVYD